MKAGVEVVTKAYANDLLFENGRVAGVAFFSMGKSFKVPSSMVIGADGVESRIGRKAGIHTQLKLTDIDSCVQYTLANIEVNSNICDFYF